MDQFVDSDPIVTKRLPYRDALIELKKIRKAVWFVHAATGFPTVDQSGTDENHERRYVHSGLVKTSKKDALDYVGDLNPNRRSEVLIKFGVSKMCVFIGNTP